MLYILFRILVFPFFWLIFRPVVYGRENMRVQGKAIFVCNHIAMGDPICFAMISPRIIHFMAKSSLFKNKLLGFLLKALFVFPVNRKEADMVSMKTALRVLERGHVFGIFPEGKRAVTNDLDELEKGAAFLAIRSNAPIIPMYIKPDSYRKLRFRAIVGAPINVGELVAVTGKSQLVDVVTDEISDSIRALKTELMEK